MYAADVEGHDGRLNFVVSGMLWERSLVMQDLETGTLWSHLLGRAMDGELEGTRLEVVPSTMTDWGSWLAAYPATEVVRFSRTARRFTRDFYRELDRFVLGVDAGVATRAYPYDRLRERGVVNERVGDVDLAIAFFADGASANAYLAKIEGREGKLVFEPDGEATMRDKQTGSVWNRQTGIAVAGELAGERLQRLPAIPSYRAAWRRFYPGSTVYGE